MEFVAQNQQHPARRSFIASGRLNRVRWQTASNAARLLGSQSVAPAKNSEADAGLDFSLIKGHLEEFL